MRSAELLRKYNIKLKKSLGQNLLLDPNINRKMAEVAGIDSRDSVFEVGAGVGDLTKVLADRAGEVFAIEIDESFEAPLRERFGCDQHVKLFFGDVLNHSVNELVARFLPDAKSLKMVSNLPYYITSPLVMHFLESDTGFLSLTVMVQKEVAERMVAGPGGKDYGILSLACQFYARPYIAHVVSPNCFRPKPRVESAVVHLALRREPHLVPPERDFFFRIVNAAFGQRRKKIVNSLASSVSLGAVGMGKEQWGLLLEEAGIRPESRPETVPIESFIQLVQRAGQAGLR